MNGPPNAMRTWSSPAVPCEVLDALRQMNRPVMISHVVPDADALGSMFAMAVAWTDAQRQPTVSLPPESLSQRLSFLFDLASVRVATPADFAKADGFVVLDTAKKPRCNIDTTLKNGDWSSDRPVVNIDHHETNTRFGQVNWIEGEASSACELVYRLLRAAERPIDDVTASLLYAGIQTDTIGFSLPTVTPTALWAAGDLVERGADIALLGEKLCRSQSRSELNLLRVIYANTTLLEGGRLAYSCAGYDEIHDAGCTAADIDDQISVPRSLDGVQLAMLFTEGNKGKTRINFRGAGEVTVVELAAVFHGGGHRQAAGAIIHAGLQEAMDQVVPRAVEHLKRFAPPCST